jgi:hypothetical protein
MQIHYSLYVNQAGYAKRSPTAKRMIHSEDWAELKARYGLQGRPAGTPY